MLEDIRGQRRMLGALSPSSIDLKPPQGADRQGIFPVCIVFSLLTPEVAALTLSIQTSTNPSLQCGYFFQVFSTSRYEHPSVQHAYHAGKVTFDAILRLPAKNLVGESLDTYSSIREDS